MTMLRQLRRRLQMKSKIALFFMILISFLLQCTLLHVISIGSNTPIFNPASYIKPYNNCKVNASYA